MKNNEMNFNKRVMLVKKEVFEGITSSNELDSIASTKKQGYYSLNTILKYLYPVLEKYEVDLDLEIYSGQIIGHWYDCISDKERQVNVDFSELREKMSQIKKLPMMANEVQSDGAEKSYTRRYAYTSILGLNATDEIENNNSNNYNYSNNSYNNKKQYKTDIPGQGTKVVTENKTIKKVSQAQLKRLFAIMNQSGQTDDTVKAFIKKKFNKDSRNDLSQEEYKYLCDRLEMKAQKEATGNELPLTTPSHAVPAQPVK